MISTFLHSVFFGFVDLQRDFIWNARARDAREVEPRRGCVTRNIDRCEVIKYQRAWDAHFSLNSAYGRT